MTSTRAARSSRPRAPWARGLGANCRKPSPRSTTASSPVRHRIRSPPPIYPGGSGDWKYEGWIEHVLEPFPDQSFAFDEFGLLGLLRPTAAAAPRPKWAVTSATSSSGPNAPGTDSRTDCERLAGAGRRTTGRPGRQPATRRPGGTAAAGTAASGAGQSRRTEGAANGAGRPDRRPHPPPRTAESASRAELAKPHKTDLHGRGGRCGCGPGPHPGRQAPAITGDARPSPAFEAFFSGAEAKPKVSRTDRFAPGLAASAAFVERGLHPRVPRPHKEPVEAVGAGPGGARSRSWCRTSPLGSTTQKGRRAKLTPGKLARLAERGVE